MGEESEELKGWRWRATFEVLVLAVPRARRVEDVEGDVEEVGQKVQVRLRPAAARLVAERALQREAQQQQFQVVPGETKKTRKKTNKRK